MTMYFIGFGMLRLLIFTFSVLLIVKIALKVRISMNIRHKEMYKKFGISKAMGLVSQRFADGEITADQYREIKSVLAAE